MVKVLRSISAFVFYCSKESFPEDRIYLVFRKFDTPGIDGWGGTTLSASQTHDIEWPLRYASLLGKL